jgi:hypothetical protein
MRCKFELGSKTTLSRGLQQAKRDFARISTEFGTRIRCTSERASAESLIGLNSDHSSITQKMRVFSDLREFSAIHKLIENLAT